MSDEEYMKIALELAKKGAGYVSPNPMVGAVIVKDGRIIGKGYHKKYGELHAERNAIANLTESAENATIYVTLEPCCHYGKTPPCTEAIIDNKISRVVIGSKDPNPLVAGKGAEILRQHGISVTENILKKECDSLNQVFFYYIQNKLPYVIMKYAMTIDGKIACHTGDSKWISGEASRIFVQELRHRCTGIMAGVETVIKDNPMLNCRMEGGKNPVRIICDSSLRTPKNSNIIKTAKDIRTILATTCNDKKRQEEYLSYGCEILTVNEKEHHVDLKELMVRLGEMQIDSILLEGGGTLNWSALNEGIVNKIMLFLAPKVFGGEAAKSPVAGIGVSHPSDAFFFENMKYQTIGEDLLLEADIKIGE